MNKYALFLSAFCLSAQWAIGLPVPFKNETGQTVTDFHIVSFPGTGFGVQGPFPGHPLPAPWASGAPQHIRIPLPPNGREADLVVNRWFGPPIASGDYLTIMLPGTMTVLESYDSANPNAQLGAYIVDIYWTNNDVKVGQSLFTYDSNNPLAGPVLAYVPDSGSSFALLSGVILLLFAVPAKLRAKI